MIDQNSIVDMEEFLPVSDVMNNRISAHSIPEHYQKLSYSVSSNACKPQNQAQSTMPVASWS